MENYSCVCFFLCWLKFFQFICDCFHAFLKSQTVAGISTTKVDRSILKLHGLLVLLPFFQEERNQALLVLITWQRSLPVSWDFGQRAIDEMRFCWSSSHSFNGLDWQTFIFVSDEVYHLYFGKLVQNTFCELPKCGWQGYLGPKQCTAIDDVCDMSLVWLDNMMTVILQSMHHLRLVSLHRAAVTCGQWPWYRSQGITVNSLLTNFKLQG